MCNCFAFGKKICYNYDMNVKEKKSERVLSAIDTAVFVITVAVFAFCLVYATVSMITGKESPIYGYGKYGMYELVQRAGVLCLVFVPFVLRRCRVYIPAAFTIAFNCFIIISVFGGTFMGLYINTKWWDKFNHTLSGILLGLAGMFFLNRITKDNEKVGAGSVVLYAFSFAVMCGVLWEIYEFTIDGIVGANMQKFRNDHTLEEYVGRAALMDTMGDIIVDAIGALAAGILCAVANAKSRSFLRMFEVKILPKKEKAVAAADELFDRRPEQTRPEVAATVADNERDLS